MMTMPTMDPPAPDELMEWATASGQVVKVLFGDPEAGGMSLVWSWFAPNFPLPRHSHSADCLYYVTRGELHMGRQVVKEGEGFFVADGASYAYSAGPEGVEVLEFRSVSEFDMQITESLPRWAKMVEIARDNGEMWAEELPDHLESEAGPNRSPCPPGLSRRRIDQDLSLRRTACEEVERLGQR